MTRRATLREPGADLARLPTGLDFRAISLLEGMRAAIATALLLLAAEWFGWPGLVTAAIGAMLACFCDLGGPIRLRQWPLLAFTLSGALAWGGGGLARDAGLGLAVPLSAVVILCCCMARVWGAAPTAVGNVTLVVWVLALDRRLGVPAAAAQAAWFAAGGLWAVLLTIFIWRINPFGPAQASLAEAWRQLANYVRALETIGGADLPAWEDHARAHRRPSRDAIEEASRVLLGTMRRRGPANARAMRVLIRLEAAEQVMAGLVALADRLEQAPALMRDALPALRRLGPVLDELAGPEAGCGEAAPDGLLPAGLRALHEAAARAGALAGLLGAIADRLDTAGRFAARGAELPGAALPGRQAAPLLARVLGPLRANLDWSSAILRHAARAAAIGTPILAFGLLWQTPYTHWLTISLVLTLQPVYAATWQRALERIGGTLLGAAIGAALTPLGHDPITLALVLFPLCVLGFSARQVSYGAYIGALTPLTVLLVETGIPGQSEWQIAAMRALFTLAGGGLALAGGLLLWPSWEGTRIEPMLREAIAAHAAYAERVFGLMLGQQAVAQVEPARRAAGLSSNNLEASLSRALQERGLGRRGARHAALLEAAMTVDAALRRLAGRLTALEFEPGMAAAETEEAWRAWREWLGVRLRALATGRVARPLPAPHGMESLARLARQVEIIEGALSRIGACPRPGGEGEVLAPLGSSAANAASPN